MIVIQPNVGQQELAQSEASSSGTTSEKLTLDMVVMALSLKIDLRLSFLSMSRIPQKMENLYPMLTLEPNLQAYLVSNGTCILVEEARFLLQLPNFLNSPSSPWNEF
ncbi:hypothetical protein SLA2020_065510 [Shorea laevis]